MSQPATVFVNNFVRCVLRINDPFGKGWKEKYDLLTDDLGTAEGWIQNLLLYRTMLLARGYRIVLVKLGIANQPFSKYSPIKSRVSPIALAGETGPPVAIGAQNNPQVSFLIAFADGQGTCVTREFRGVRDSHVSNTGLTFVHDPLAYAPTIPGQTYGATVAGTTGAVAFNSFASWVRDNCALYNGKTIVAPGPPPVLQWGKFAFKQWQFDGIGSRDTGRGYSFRRRRRKQKI